MSIDKDGLSIVQWKAANIYALGTRRKDDIIAKSCGIEISTLRTWKKDPRFKIAVLKKFEENMAYLRAKRIFSVEKFLSPLCVELGKKLKKGKLEEADYSVKELINMVTKLYSELRVDAEQFTKNKTLLYALAEFTGRDPALMEDEESEDTMDIAQKRYIERKSKFKKEREEKITSKGKKKKKKKKTS